MTTTNETLRVKALAQVSDYPDSALEQFMRKDTLSASTGAERIGYNGETVDSALDKLNSTVAGVASTVSPIPNRLSTVESAIPALNSAIEDLESNQLTTEEIDSRIQAAIPVVTKNSIGLSNVDNTSDLNKPISTAQQAALNLKVNTADLSKASVGLSNVDNTSDANKPVSNAQQTALNLKQTKSEKDASDGFVGLTGFSINLKNIAGAIKSIISSAATAARTWTFPDKSGTVALMDDVQNPTVNSMNGGPLAGMRNYLINGCMRVAQRGTSFTIPPNSGAYTLDRWTIWNGTNAPLVVQVATVGNYNGSDMTSRMRLAMQTAPTTGTVFVTQRIEGVHTLAGKEVVASATFLSEEATMQTRFTLGQYFGVNGSPTVTQYGAFMAPTSSAMQASVSKLTLPSIVGKTIGANNTLDFTFELLPRTTLGHTLTEVQLEQGPIVTPFERRPIAVELALCQRYYEKISLGDIYTGAGSGTATGYYVSIPFKVPKRVPPTTYALPADLQIWDAAGVTQTPTSKYVRAGSVDGFTLAVEYGGNKIGGVIGNVFYASSEY